LIDFRLRLTKQSSAAGSFITYSPSPEIGLFDFNVSSDGAVEGAFIDQPFLLGRVDWVDVEPTQIRGLPGRNVSGKKAQNLPEFPLRNLRQFVVPVFPIRIRSLAVN